MKNGIIKEGRRIGVMKRLINIRVFFAFPITPLLQYSMIPIFHHSNTPLPYDFDTPSLYDSHLNMRVWR